MSNLPLRMLIASTCILASTASQNVLAAAADTAPLEEIVVTANRKQETLSKVSASVAAFTPEIMEAKGIKSVEDVARFTPGVTFGQSGDGLTRRIAIRGIASTVGAATTGIYIDDTPIQVRGGTGVVTENVYPAVFDQERIEILRGPQGTLYGAGAAGGAVRFLTAQPSLTDFSGHTRAEIAFTESGDPTYEAGVAAGGPLSQGKIGFRASAFFRNDGGFIDSVDRASGVSLRDNKDSQQTTVLRGALTFAIGDALTITPSVLYQNKEADGTGYFWTALSNPDEGKFRSAWPQQEPSSDEFWLPALKVTWNLANLELISNTSYFDRSLQRSSDYSTLLWALLVGNPNRPVSNIPGYRALSNADVEQDTFTQEVRLQSTNADSRLQWVAGLFYEKARLYTNQYVEDPYLPQLSLQEYGVTIQQAFGQGLVDGIYSFVVDQHATDQQLAAFGQVDYALTEKLKVTAGVRVASTEFDYARTGNGPLNCLNCRSGGHQEETPVTPKVGFTYEYDDRNLYYVSASKGYRVGGINNPSATTTPTCAANLALLGLTSVPSTYDSDSLWSYEIGAKNRSANGKVQLYSSIYFIDWSDIQQAVTLGGCGSSFKANLGDATSKGLDIAAEFRPMDNLTLTLAAGYTDAQYAETVYAGLNTTTNPPTRRILVSDGNSLGVAPWNATVSAAYDFVIAQRDAYWRVDYAYTARDDEDTPYRDSITVNYDKDVRPDPALRLLSARAGMRIAGWDVSLFGENLLNEAPLLGRYHDIKGMPQFFASTLRPRTIGLTGIFRF
jgi:outer membrane receptor protein involved in Fe transport